MKLLLLLQRLEGRIEGLFAPPAIASEGLPVIGVGRVARLGVAGIDLGEHVGRLGVAVPVERAPSLAIKRVRRVLLGPGLGGPRRQPPRGGALVERYREPD